MANETKIIEIKIDASQAIQTITQLDTEIDKLKKNQTELTKSGQKNSEQYQENAIKIKEYSAQKRILQSEVQKEIKGTQDAMGAYAKLQIEYTKAAQKAKDLAAQHGVGNAKTQEATKKANDLNNKLKEIDASMGNHQRNVGNYSSVIDMLPGSLGSAAQGVAGLGKQFMALLAHPVVLVISAIVGAFMLLKKGLETNREGIDRLNQILAPFKAILQFILVQIGNFANLLLKGVQAIGDFAMKILSFIPAVKKLNETNKEAIQIEKDLQRIRRSEITDMANDAITDRKIADLNKKMRMKDVYDEKQRLAFAREVDRLALEGALDDKKMAEDELQSFIKQKRLEGQYSQKQYNTEDYKKFAELVVKKESALKEYYEKTTRSASVAAQLQEEIDKENAEKFAEFQRQKAERQRDYRIRTLAEFNTLLKNQIEGFKTSINNELSVIESATNGANEKLNQKLSESGKFASENFKNDLQNKLDATVEGSNAEMNARLEILDAQMMQELSAKELTERQKATITKKYAKIESDIRTQTLQNQLSNTANALGQIKGLFEEGTKAAKITESAQVAINSISGAIAAFKSVAGIPVVGPFLGAAAAAGVIASGYKAIKDIWAVDEKNGATNVSATDVQTPDLTSKISAPMTSTAQQVAGFGGANTITSGAQNTSVGTNVINNIKVPKAVISIQELREKENSVDYLDTLATI